MSRYQNGQLGVPKSGHLCQCILRPSTYAVRNLVTGGLQQSHWVFLVVCDIENLEVEIAVVGGK